MNWVDVLVAVAMLWSALRGAARGFWTQFFVAASVVLGVLVAFWAYAFLVHLVGRGSGFTPHALRFLGAAVAGMLVFGLLQLAAERTGSRINASIFGPVNRLCGLALGLVAGLVSASLVLLALAQPIVPRPLRHAVLVSTGAPWLFALGEDATRALGRRVPGTVPLAEAFGRARTESGRVRTESGRARTPRPPAPPGT